MANPNAYRPVRRNEPIARSSGKAKNQKVIALSSRCDRLACTRALPTAVQYWCARKNQYGRNRFHSIRRGANQSPARLVTTVSARMISVAMDSAAPQGQCDATRASGHADEGFNMPAQLFERGREQQRDDRNRYGRIGRAVGTDATHQRQVSAKGEGRTEQRQIQQRGHVGPGELEQ